MKKQFSFFMLLITVCAISASCNNYKNNDMSNIIGKFYKDSVRSTGENGEGWVYNDNVPFYKIESNGKTLEVKAAIYDGMQSYIQRMNNYSDFKCYPYPKFRQRILDLYGIDMDTTYYATLASYGPDDFVACHEGFVIGFISEDDEELDSKISIELNKMIIDDDVHAFNWMKKNSPEEIIFQVEKAGVCTNKRWMKYVLENVDFERTIGATPVLYDYLFGYDSNNLLVYRPQMLDTLIANGVSMALLSSVLEQVEIDKQDNRSNLYQQPINQIIDSLYMKVCDEGQTGYIEYRIDHDPTLLSYFKTKEYFGFDWFKSFCEELYETPDKRAERGVSSSLDPTPTRYGIIVDDDGYVNMRERPTIGGNIICRISSGLKVEILGTEGNWVYISTKIEGSQIRYLSGYIHKSRIEEIR